MLPPWGQSMKFEGPRSAQTQSNLVFPGFGEGWKSAAGDLVTTHGDDTMNSQTFVVIFV